MRLCVSRDAQGHTRNAAGGRNGPIPSEFACHRTGFGNAFAQAKSVPTPTSGFIAGAGFYALVHQHVLHLWLLLPHLSEAASDGLEWITEYDDRIRAMPPTFARVNRPRPFLSYRPYCSAQHTAVGGGLKRDYVLTGEHSRPCRPTRRVRRSLRATEALPVPDRSIRINGRRRATYSQRVSLW